MSQRRRTRDIEEEGLDVVENSTSATFFPPEAAGVGGDVVERRNNKGGKAESKLEEDVRDFDDVIERVDPLKKYQKMLLYWAISPICAIQPIISYNSIFMLFAPEHWCAGLDRENYDDVEEYKLINIPMHNTSDGLWKYSSCSSYGRNGTEPSCKSGWEFDKSEYEKTMTTEFSWVCENSSIPQNALLMGVIGNAIGILGCGLLSDTWGRKPAMFLAILINALFRFTSLFVAQNWILFYLCQFMVGMAHTNVYIIPSLIAAEISNKDDRAEVYATTWTVCLVGLCVLPTLSWLCGDWFIIGIVTVCFCAALLLYIPLVPESPRWLLQKGQLDKCVDVLDKIQNYNKSVNNLKDRRQYSSVELHRMLEQVLSIQKSNDSSPERGEKPSITVLFTKFNLAKNTFLLAVCWSVNTLIYGVMTFNATHMSGSHFTNFFLLGIIELPSGFIGGYLADTVGRRWTQTFGFLFCALSCFGTSFVVHDRELEIAFALLSKLVATIAFIVAYLQAAELFPTELRSTGGGIASTTANFIAISAPVIAQMSTVDATHPWYFIGALSILGMVAAAFLPETLNVSLPETVDEANNLGRKRKSYLPMENPNLFGVVGGGNKL